MTGPGPPASFARHLVLIGMMGVGKSSAGRRLALRLGRPFVDTDQLVEERAGKSVAEIFRTDGEPAFRVLESETVRATLDSRRWSVIAFGGGAVLDPANRQRAREAGCVVWLQAPPRDLARRVSASLRRSAGSSARPLIQPGQSPEAVLEAIAREREDAYREAAHVTVDTEGKSPGQVAAAVLAATGWPVPPRPVEPRPVEPRPVEPRPVEPRPVEPSPVEPSPVEPSPVEPAPPPGGPEPPPP